MATRMMDGRRLRAQRRRAQTEARLLEAAEAVICRKGFHAATISDIVVEAGVARGTFYQYFQGRDEVFRRLISDFVTVLNASVDRVTERRAPLEDVRLNVLRVLLQLFAHRDLAILLFRDALTPDPELQRLQADLHEHMHRMVCGALRRGAEWGMLRAVDVEGTSWAIIGAIKELLLRRLDDMPSGGARLPLSADAEFDPTVREAASSAAAVLVDAFYGGLRTP